MDETTITRIDTDMRKFAAREGKKQQIAGSEVIDIDPLTLAILIIGCARNLNTGPAVGIVDQATAIEPPRIRTTKAIGGSYHLKGIG